MEEKNEIKISLSTVFLIIALIVIVIMGIFIYKFYNDKTIETKKTNELEAKVNDLNGIIGELKEKNNGIQKIDNSSNTIENSVERTNLESNSTSLDNSISKTELNYAKEYIQIIDRIKDENPESNIKCDLIYFNNDNIPDLVIGNLDYWVSLYIYENGNIYNPIDRWPYGAAGNTGYEYQEKKAIIRNHNSDFAGAIITKSIFILNSRKGFDELSDTQRGTISENDDIEAINAALESYGGYFYNSKKITEQEYNNKLNELSININDNNFKWLIGSKSTEEVKNQLQNK